jgi:hypothetical protein
MSSPTPPPTTRRRSRIPDLIDLGGDFLGNYLSRRTAGNAGNALRTGIDAAGQRISDASRRGMGFEEDALNEQRGLYSDRRQILRDALGRQEGLYGDQQNTLNEGLDRQEGLYRERRGGFEPYAARGRQALDAYGKLIEEPFKFDVSQVEKDPGYKYGMDEGIKGVGRFLSAKGTLNSGQEKDFIRFARDYASKGVTDAFNRQMAERQNRFGEVSGLTGVGERAAGNQSAVSGDFANQIGDNAVNQANLTGRFADRVGETARGESDIAGDFGDQLSRSATNRSALTLAEGANLADLELARGNVGADQAVQSGNATRGLVNTAVNAGTSILSKVLGGGGAGAGVGATTASGIAMPSMATIATVAAPVAAAIAVGALIKSQAHWEANDIVQNMEQPFHYKSLAPFAASWDAAIKAGTMTRQAGQEAFDGYLASWENYLNEIEKWAGNSSDRKKVANQSAANLYQTTVAPQIRRMQNEIAGLPA